MTISTTYNPETDRHELMVSDGRMSPSPAGERLFRLPDRPTQEQLAAVPQIYFSYEVEADAVKAAAKLRAYLEQLPAKKQSKKELKGVGA
jgi:hypothetical protein